MVGKLAMATPEVLIYNLVHAHQDSKGTLYTLSYYKPTVFASQSESELEHLNSGRFRLENSMGTQRQVSSAARDR